MTTLLVPGTAKTSLAIADLLSASSRPYVLGVRSKSNIPHPTVQLDLANASTWLPALTSQADLTTIYLLPPPMLDFVPTLTEFINLAVSHDGSQIRRIVFLSSTLIEKGGPAHGQVHLFLDTLVSEGKLVEYAILRPTWFTQNFSTKGSLHEVTIRDESKIYSATGDGKLPFVDVADIAAVGYHALTDSFSNAQDSETVSGVHTTPNGKGKEYLILGPELLTYSQVAEYLSNILGRQIEWIGLSVNDLAKKLASATGMNESYAPVLASLDGIIAGGEEERIFEREQGGCVRSLVGRDARTASQVLAEEFRSS